MIVMYKFVGLLFFAFLLAGCQEEKSEKTIERGQVMDRNGHVYQTVKIGDDWWMAENLKVTVFNDSTPLVFIDQTSLESDWANVQEPAFTFTNDSLYGLLYNFKSVYDIRKLAPEGWHIATEEEWQRLEETIGLPNSEILDLGWRGTNEAEKLAPLYSRGWPEFCELFGSDDYGFKALPGGCCLFNGELNVQNNTAFWWTASSFDDSEAWYRYMDYNQDRIFRQHTYMGYGMSVRCVKNK